jgi:hypothetical protein
MKKYKTSFLPFRITLPIFEGPRHALQAHEQKGCTGGELSPA